ncbi:glycosyl hydrolase family 95 catalytic domain-containing protein [Dysgonomonas sp. HGC4]|uniref:glycoside hydrolase family 95 protein n=1 Tax=Dysgonomonas sp. HGC4 TaxID=1658009 RepID=UPI00068261A1|nr:glycoside hydrolase family 95 protein [Dysgonomonas sp. HGC4]MBD8346873.1 glycoside hydrolase family 95 protein [Dysgonomonas sp. HGC4]
MKKIKGLALTLLLLIFMNVQVSASPNNNRHRLWYKQPAKVWMESSPLGNGRIGAMVYGGVETETVALNEVTMWSGERDKFQERLCGKDILNDIRQLFFAGDYSKGNRIASEYLSGTPHSFGSHVPLGDMKINFKYPQGNISDYKRELNLENAINTITFKVRNVKYTREYFCSNPDEALIIKLSASKAKALNLNLSFDLLRESEMRTTNNGLEFSGQVSFPKQGPGGVNFLGKVGVTIKDGKVTTKDGKIEITDATSIVIAFDVRTDYSNPKYKEDCVKTVDNVLAQNYDKVKQNHIGDYSNLYKRVDLFLGNSETDNLPTDIRWKKVKDGANDVGLDALFFNYARYLLIAASRENSPLPANLQGIWNDNLACNMGWTNDYHLDINTQQNYWLSNIGNLAECNKPLFNYIKDLSIEGQRTAKNVYGARGWTAHTVANVWGYTSPGAGPNWGLFPMASAWIASHLWTHYNYTLDKDFLKDKAYPILKSNAEFLLDYMVVNPNNGYLMTGPSTSPENSFIYKGEELSLSMMPTADRVLAFEALTSCIEISDILGVDKEFRDSLKNALAKLPPLKIGKNGGVQEWFEDFDEAQPNHRHTSHLLALYPFSQISPVKTPVLAEAARKTMELRLAAEGWEDVEWSRANMISNYARLLDAEKAYESVVLLERNFSRENLLTISPEGIAGAPYDIFIFDGNEAGGAGIAEMLLQSHEGYIQFLPALPKEWNTGSFKGLHTQGGAEIDLKWANGEVTEAKLKAISANTFKLKVPQRTKKAQFSKNGKAFNLTPDANGFVEVTLSANDFIELK